MKYYIIAGEASGDLHGSNLIKGLRQADPGCTVRCWGGDLMANAGDELVRHYKDTAIIGFWEVAKSLGKIMRNMRECCADILQFNPDLVILIDYPGFNFRIAKFAHNHGFKVFYYIAPKIWAWKEHRGKRLQKYVDKLFIIFPFETDYFKKRWNIDAVYRGNPLLDSIEQYQYIEETKEDFCKRTNILLSGKAAPSASYRLQELSARDKFIALLAGSRRGEISYLLPRMLDVMANFPDYKFLLAAAPSIPESYYEETITAHLKKHPARGIRERLVILQSQTYSVMKHSDAAIVSSGTASLETALIGTPQVVCYGSSALTYFIAKHLVKGIKYISLANLILNKLIFKELIQYDCTPQKISEELHRLLSDAPYIAAMKADYRQVRTILGGGGASKAVAEAVVQEYDKMRQVQEK